MRQRNRPYGAHAWAALALLFTAAIANATTFRKEATIVDLLNQSDLILQGRVKHVQDGFDQRGIPYTEITLEVAESIKGQAGREFKFRQFGLLKPRRMGDGRVNLMVTPAAWASYAPGEETILFLRKAAAWTGLRTTAGLGQGKFNVRLAGAVNRTDNAGLFRDVQVDPSLLGEADQRVMTTKKGAVNAKAFVGLVRQAVAGKWVEKGRMRNAHQ